MVTGEGQGGPRRAGVEQAPRFHPAPELLQEAGVLGGWSLAMARRCG